MSSITSLGNNSNPRTPDLNIRVEGVTKILKGLSPHKASGQDQISSRVLKEMATEIFPDPCLPLYQASVEQGQIPKEWKAASVSPVFKKWDKSKASNYRPVESGSFRSYFHSVRSFRHDFRDESFRPIWGGSFRLSFKGESVRPDLRGESFRPDIIISGKQVRF